MKLAYRFVQIAAAAVLAASATFSGTEVNQPALGEQQQATPAWERIIGHGDMHRAPVLSVPLAQLFAVAGW